MPGSETEIQNLRRALHVLVEGSYTKICAAVLLLERSAAMHPKTDIAHAHAVLLEAKRDIARWILCGGEAVGIHPMTGQRIEPPPAESPEMVVEASVGNAER